MFGVLALQGAVTPHKEIIEKLGFNFLAVRNSNDLAKTNRLIIPGGESTTMLKLMKQSDLWQNLKAYTNPVWGICAGAILAAKEVANPEQASLGLIDIRAERNSYGSQNESFKAKIFSEKFPNLPELDFIRAPRLFPIGKEVSVLGTFDNDSVIMQQGNILVSSFHIELCGDPTLHIYFSKL